MLQLIQFMTTKKVIRKIKVRSRLPTFEWKFFSASPIHKRYRAFDGFSRCFSSFHEMKKTLFEWKNIYIAYKILHESHFQRYFKFPPKRIHRSNKF